MLEKVLNQIEAFLLHYCSSSAPLLLALSGGPDSLCLFYALLSFRERHKIAFHAAHVDHRWRQESREEANDLSQLALKHGVPFHLKTLDPFSITGNLEAACREERYAFFAQLNQKFSFQAILTGHHQDDRAETVFKRLLEGAHWSCWVGLQSESWMKGMRILRPLLKKNKQEIQKALQQSQIQAFDDPSNRHTQFLRARLRETIFPRLNQEFGKQIQTNLIVIGEMAQEFVEYFEERLIPLLETQIRGPWGVYIDLQGLMPTSLLEIKYLLRLLCQQQKFFASREILAQAAKGLQAGVANQMFVMGTKQIRIDRQRIFIITHPLLVQEDQDMPLHVGCHLLGNWEVKLSEETDGVDQTEITSWKEGWTGKLKSYLPKENYQIEWKKEWSSGLVNKTAIKKRWNQAKVPAFLCSYFPLLTKEGKIYHEFLTGQSPFVIPKKSKCWKLELTYFPSFSSFYGDARK